MSRVLAVIFGIQCASGYRHEMHLKTHNEASSNKSTPHGGASGDTQASLTCVTGLDSIDCEGSNAYFENSFKYMGNGKCCTQKSMACEEGSSPYTCEGLHGEGKKKGWKFIRSEEYMRGKCCLVTDSQASLTCETGVKDFDCQGIFLQDTDSYKYMGHGTCCTQKRITCQASSSKQACEGFDGEEKKKGWKFLTHKCCLDLDAQANTGWFGWR